MSENADIEPIRVAMVDGSGNAVNWSRAQRVEAIASCVLWNGEIWNLKKYYRTIDGKHFAHWFYVQLADRPLATGMPWDTTHSEACNEYGEALLEGR